MNTKLKVLVRPAILSQSATTRVKFLIARRLLPVLLLLAVPVAVEAQYSYTTNDGAITITGYDCSTGGGAVTIPSTINGLPVTSIGDRAFWFCAPLTSVTVPNNVTNVGAWAFEECYSLTNVLIGNSVTTIGVSAFMGCTGLTSITIPDSVTTIGGGPGGEDGPYGAFAFCTSLTNVTIGNRVASIGATAFKGCTGLTRVTIPDSVTTIGGAAFRECTSLTSFTIPNNVTSLGGAAFWGCTSLTNVTIGNGVTSIGGGTFYGCSSLITMTMGAGVTNIELYAFESCSSLTSVTIGSGVISIGYEAFEGCASLTNVTIGKSVTSVLSGDAGVFNNCTSLSAITVDPFNSVYSSIEGVLFNKSQTALIEYPPAKAGSYTIPNSVATIAAWAFHICTGLTSVTIPNTVTVIGDYAFNHCTSLTRMYFEGNRPRPGSSLFFKADDVIVYYLPGTTGWGSTYSSRPTMLWNPQALTSDLSFGVRAGQFGFTITGTPGITVVIEATPDLTNPIWTPLSTITLTAGSSHFTDPQWTAQPTRFYRLRSHQ